MGKLLGRSFLLPLVAFLLSHQIGFTSTYSLERHSRRGPVPPQNPVPSRHVDHLDHMETGAGRGPVPPQNPVPSEQMERLIDTLRQLRDTLAKSYVYKAASEISDYSEPEEQLEKLETQKAISAHVMDAEEPGTENEVIEDDPDGPVSEKHVKRGYSVDENVLLSKMLSILLKDEDKTA